MNIKLGTINFEIHNCVKITGYTYRQVNIKNYIGQFENKIGSDTYYSDENEIYALHKLLCEEAGLQMDNHQAFNVGGLWLRFDDNRVNIGTDAVIGVMGQF